MPLSFEPGIDDHPLTSTTTLKDGSISQKSIIRATINELYASEPKTEPDSRLLNWKRYIQERRRQHKAIESATKRKPDQLCMNAGEDQRYIVEQKQMLEFCRTPWTPNVLKIFAPGETRSALCYGHPTLAESCIATPALHVGVPKCIQVEKDVFGQGDRKTKRERWIENPSLFKKTEQLDEQYVEANPHEPYMDDLAVVGNNMMRSVQLGSIVVPVISVYQESEFRELDDPTSSSSLQVAAVSPSDEETFACLKINERTVSWSLPREPSSQGSTLDSSVVISDIDKALNVHKLVFKAATRQKVKDVIRFENIGNVKIRFSWHRKTNTEALPGGEGAHTSNFFFNKNSGVFLPGQIYNFPFWFETEHVGIFEELWTLTTDPSLLKDGYRACVHLYADASRSAATDAQDGLSSRDVYQYLTRREIESAAAALVAEMADRPRPLLPTSSYDFLHHRDTAFKDIGLDEVRFGPDFVERVARTFGVSALDQLRAQHHVQPVELKKHSCVYGLLGDVVNRMERHARLLEIALGLAGDEADPPMGDADADALLENILPALDDVDGKGLQAAGTAQHGGEVTSARASLRQIASDAARSWRLEQRGATSSRRVRRTELREALAARLYADLCGAVEDASLAMDEADSPRLASCFVTPPVDRIGVPDMPEPPATLPPQPSSVPVQDRRGSLPTEEESPLATFPVDSQSLPIDADSWEAPVDEAAVEAARDEAGLAEAATDDVPEKADGEMLPVPGPVDRRLPLLVQVFDFGGTKTTPPEPRDCPKAMNFPLTDYTFDQIGIADLPPLPKLKEEKGKKDTKKGKKDAKKGKKDAKKANKGSKKGKK